MDNELDNGTFDVASPQTAVDFCFSCQLVPADDVQHTLHHDALARQLGELAPRRCPHGCGVVHGPAVTGHKQTTRSGRTEPDTG